MVYHHRGHWEEIGESRGTSSSYIITKFQMFHYLHLALVNMDSGDAFQVILKDNYLKYFLPSALFL